MSQTEPVTDSWWAANQAVLALQDGRYALGAAFARIAASALQQEQMHVQMPDPDVPVVAGNGESTAVAGPWEPPPFAEPNAPAEPKVETLPMITGRCVAHAVKDGIGGECHGAVFLGPDDVWRHVDYTVTHTPIVRA